MKIWVVSMECAGLAEAGGVKNVTHSLCQEFANKNNEVTLFTPIFGCTNFDSIENYQEENIPQVKIDMCDKPEYISYSSGTLKNTKVKVVFINHKSFSEKKAVYVYTEEEEKANPENKKGTGHKDSLFLDTLLSKAVAEYGKFIDTNELPDIIHCHDASTAITPAYAKNQYPELYNNTKCVVTIHNAGPAYHHEFIDFGQAKYYTHLDNFILENSNNNGRIEPFLIAAQYSKLTTVSSYYAEELTNPKNNDITDGLANIFYQKQIPIFGITNGIDFERYNPKNKKQSLLPYEFDCTTGQLKGKTQCREFFLSQIEQDNLSNNFYFDELIKYGYIEKPKDESKTIYFSYHGRVVYQKGVNLLEDVVGKIINFNENSRLIIMGQGDKELEYKTEKLTQVYPGKILYLKGYNQACARLVLAATDFCIIPSHFEPCCLEDFISQIYGTLPIAHRTGGLNKIIDESTGFTYFPNTPEIIENKIVDVSNKFISNKEKINQMIVFAANYVKDNYAWSEIVKKYLSFFEKI
jgi:starch synthase